MRNTTPVYELSNDELMQFPKLNLDDDGERLCTEARKAEDKGENVRAQLLWEYAVRSVDIRLPTREEADIHTDDDCEAFINRYAYSLTLSAVILPHLRKLMAEKLSFQPLDSWNARQDKSQRPPVGAHKRAWERLSNDKCPEAPDFPAISLLVYAVLTALCAVVALPVSMAWNLPGIYMTEYFILSICIAGLTHFLGVGCFGTIVGFGLSYAFFGWLQDAVSKLLYNKLALESMDMATAYFCRGLHGLLALIFLLCIISAVAHYIKKKNNYARERERWEKSRANHDKELARFLWHLKSCRNACDLWRGIGFACDIPEAFAARLKWLYVSADEAFEFFGFKEINGSKEGIGEADKIGETFTDLYFYYNHLIEEYGAPKAEK